MPPPRAKRLLPRFTAPNRRGLVAFFVLALLFGQASLQIHALDHALDDGSPVCEICTVAQSAADVGVGDARLPATGPAPSAPSAASGGAAGAPRCASARDPPQISLS